MPERPARRARIRRRVQSEKFVEAHGGRIGDISIYGQESNYTTWRLAKMTLPFSKLCLARSRAFFDVSLAHAKVGRRSQIRPLTNGSGGSGSFPALAVPISGHRSGPSPGGRSYRAIYRRRRWAGKATGDAACPLYILAPEVGAGLTTESLCTGTNPGHAPRTSGRPAA